MAGYNRIIMVGNLTRDPEYKQLASGQAVCRLGLASNRQFKNRQTGDMVQEVCFVDIDVWGAQAESCRQYLQKGRQVLIEGRLKFDTWEDPNGQNRSKHTIVADRVVFLAAQDSATVDYEQTSNALEKDLADQIDDIRAKVAEKVAADLKVEPAQRQTIKSKKQQSSTGDFEFKDEPPFQDDLPF